MQRGRPRVAAKTTQLNVLLTPKQRWFLSWYGGGNLSRGVRRLIDEQIAREDDDPESEMLSYKEDDDGFDA